MRLPELYRLECDRNYAAGKPYYLLVGGKIKPCTMAEHVLWFENPENRKIDETDLTQPEYAAYPGGDFLSTVFLGIDHNWRGGPPILFETMLFGGEWNEHQWRYHTLEEAQVGHQMILQCLRAGLEPEYRSMDDPRWLETFFQMYTGEDK